MEPLWEERKHYVRFNPAKHNIADTRARDFKEFIPYYRKYRKLSQSQLLDLIACAKANRWQALDLTCCGLSELPDELWDLPDLQMLYLGNDRYPTNRVEMGAQVYEDNHITFLPRNIERLENLQVLSLAGNHLIDTGGSPLSMKKLIYLNVFSSGYLQFPNLLLIPTLRGLGFNCQEKFLERDLSKKILSLENFCQRRVSRAAVKEEYKICALSSAFVIQGYSIRTIVCGAVGKDPSYIHLPTKNSRHR